MQPWKRLLFYLLLNVVVSALTALVVLLIWDSVRMPRPSESHLLAPGLGASTTVVIPGISAATQQSVITGQTEGTSAAAQVNANPPQAASQDTQVVISSVVAAGDLVAERVVVKRIGGEGELSLANWSLKCEGGPVYTFPQLVLYKDGAVNVHTVAGTDTVVDLYWGVSQAAWRPGSSVTLLDPQGKVQSIYKVP